MAFTQASLSRTGQKSRSEPLLHDAPRILSMSHQRPSKKAFYRTWELAERMLNHDEHVEAMDSTGLPFKSLQNSADLDMKGRQALQKSVARMQRAIPRAYGEAVPARQLA